ncbi:MAG: outer membrane protein assembly factor BamD [Phycisphaerae bacterium]
MRIALLLTLVLVCGCFAEQFVLDGGSFSPASEIIAPEELALSRITHFATKGEREQLDVAIEDYAARYPELTGADWVLYVDAERKLAVGNIDKAEPLFEKVADDYPLSRYVGQVMEGMYSCGRQYLAGKKRRVLKLFKVSAYDEGEAIMRNLIERSPDSFLAKRAYLALAESFEQRREYIKAYNVWVEVSTRWPTGTEGRNSLLEMARNMHQAYLGTRYDATTLRSAIGYYGQFAERYPSEAERLEVDKAIKLAIEQMADKTYAIAVQYMRVQDYESAIAYFNVIEEKWPESPLAAEARKLIADSNKELAYLADNPREKPENRNLIWRFMHFFEFEVK